MARYGLTGSLLASSTICDCELRDVLLESEIPIRGKKDLEFIFDGEREELAIFNSSPTHFLRGHSEMARQCGTKSPIQAFIDEYPHRLNQFQHLELSSFDHGNGLLAFHRRKASRKSSIDSPPS